MHKYTFLHLLHDAKKNLGNKVFRKLSVTQEEQNRNHTCSLEGKNQTLASSHGSGVFSQGCDKGGTIPQVPNCCGGAK